MIDSNSEYDKDGNKVIYTAVTMYNVVHNGQYMTENLSNLPSGTSIFTLPITASFDCMINVDKIYKYYPLYENDIVTIKSAEGIRTLNPKEYAKQGDEFDNFMNQITIIMMISTDETLTDVKAVNIKIFNNGSIQVSGLKSIFQCNYAINKLVNLLKGEYIIYVKNANQDSTKNTQSHNFWTHGCVKKTIKFIEESENEIWIIEPTISTINLTYKYRTKINQSQFYYKIKELKLHKIITENVVVLLQTDINSPVSLWLNSSVDSQRYLTIAIFESGSISIMACKCREDVLYAYNFIINILNEYEDLVSKKSIIPIITNDDEIMKYIDMDALEKVKDMY